MEGQAPNQYAAPKTDTRSPGDNSNSELTGIREDHIRRESSIKTVGFLVLLPTAVLTISVVFCLIGLETSAEADVPFVRFIVILSLVTAAFGWTSGVLLLRLHPFGRIVFTLLVAASLLQVLLRGDVPFGFLKLILPAAFMCVLWGEPADMVLSSYYRNEVIPGTPEIRYILPPWAILLVGLVCLVAIIAIISLMQ